MKCFEGYIGVGINCTTKDTDSGKYITDLPGISLQNIDAVADDNQLSFTGVFKDVEKRSISRISKDVLSFMKSKYNLKKSVKTYSSNGNLSDSESSLNSNDGINIYSDFEDSELIRLYVSKVYLYSLAEVETTIKIISKSVELYTKTFTTSIGWNEIYVNQSFDSCCLNIVYDTSVFSEVPNYILESDYCACVYDICNDCDIKHRSVYIDGNNYQYGTNTHGIKVDVSLRCMHDSIICTNLDMYSDAYLYCLGMELMRERIYTDRVNRFTTVDKKKAQELLTLFTQDYSDFLDTANNSIHIKNDSCIECLETSGSSWILP